MRLPEQVTSLCLLLILFSVYADGADLGQIANSLKAEYSVQRNGIPLRMGPTTITTYLANISLTNTGSRDILPGGWSLYICHDKLIHPMFYNMSTQQYAGSGLILPGNFTVRHSVGCMFNFAPYQGEDPKFQALPLKPGQTVIIPIVASEFFVSAYSAFPKWYIANETHTNILPNTIDNKFRFVGPFDSDIQYTRFVNDFDGIIYSPIDRYRGYTFLTKQQTKNKVLPTPFLETQKNGKVTLDRSWFIDYNNEASLQKIANYLQRSIKDDTGLNLKLDNFADGTPNVIQIKVSQPKSSQLGPEAYTFQVNTKRRRITINGYSQAAVKNGIQTLRSILADGKTLQDMTIHDYPRLSYRGLELDLSSNFFGLRTVKKILDVLGLYKINKLVLILGANDGWRIDMSPEVPELARVGGKRCHDLKEQMCLMSQLGSSPDGSDGGYFTAEEYQELLKYADDKNIEIIPHINMAGSARAAIKSMSAHAAKTGDTSMILEDPNDQKLYMTPNLYSDSATNPCLPNSSTLRFFEFVLRKLKEYHDAAGIQLKHIHVGGEDSPWTAWLNSTHCQKLYAIEKEDLYLELKVNYSMAIGQIAERQGVSLIALDEFYIAWPSKLPFQRIRPLMTPFRRSRFPPASPQFDVISVSKTFYQLPQAHRPQHMADNDYKVIMQPDDYFNLHYATEPNPRLPGEYDTRMRYINASRVFNFLPENLCCNYQLSDEAPFGCMDSNNCLELNNKDNILGVQASLSTRHIKDEETLFKLLLPRAIAYAERAWHKSKWEDTYKVHQVTFNNQTGPSVNISTPDLVSRDKDWARFASIVGYKEFPRLVNQLDAVPNIPSPGARKERARVKGVQKEILKVDSMYPGLIQEIQVPGATKWLPIAKVTDVSKVPHKSFEIRSRINGQQKKPKSSTREKLLMSQEETMPLVFQSYRQEILSNITRIRREMAVRRQMEMERARQMEMARMSRVNAFMPGPGVAPNQFGPQAPPFAPAQGGPIRQQMQPGQPPFGGQQIPGGPNALPRQPIQTGQVGTNRQAVGNSA